MSQFPPSPPPQPSNVPPTPGYIPPYTPPPAPRASNRTLWIVLGSGAGLLLLCIGVTLIGALSLLGGRVNSAFSEVNQEVAAPIVQPTALPIDPTVALTPGARMELGDFDVIIKGVRTDQGTADIKPEPDYEFLYLDLELTNRSRRSQIPYDGINPSFIQDQANLHYYSTPLLDDTDILYNYIKPGATVEVRTAYEVPQTATRLYWVFEDTIDNKQVITTVR